MRNPQIEAIRSALAAKRQESIDAFQPHSLATRSAAVLSVELQRAGDDMLKLAHTTAAKVAALEADDVMNPAGRDRLLAETRAGAASTLKQLKQRQNDALTRLRGSLRASALPKVRGDREMPARDEARMMLDATPDPEIAMMEMAERGGELAAVVTGSWGESYLRARGVREAPRYHEIVQTAAIGASAMGADPALSAAGKAYFALDSAKMGADASYQLAADEMADVGAAG